MWWSPGLLRKWNFLPKWVYSYLVFLLSFDRQLLTCQFVHLNWPCVDVLTRGHFSSLQLLNISIFCNWLNNFWIWQSFLAFSIYLSIYLSVYLSPYLSWFFILHVSLYPISLTFSFAPNWWQKTSKIQSKWVSQWRHTKMFALVLYDFIQEKFSKIQIIILHVFCSDHTRHTSASTVPNFGKLCNYTVHHHRQSCCHRANMAPLGASRQQHCASCKRYPGLAQRSDFQLWPIFLLRWQRSNWGLAIHWGYHFMWVGLIPESCTEMSFLIEYLQFLRSYSAVSFCEVKFTTIKF